MLDNQEMCIRDRVGDGPSHVVLEALRGNPEQLHDHLSYLTRTKDGKILKSTTIYIRDDDGAPIRCV